MHDSLMKDANICNSEKMVINDQVRVHTCKLTDGDHFGGHPGDSSSDNTHSRSWERVR